MMSRIRSAALTPATLTCALAGLALFTSSVVSYAADTWPVKEAGAKAAGFSEEGIASLDAALLLCASPLRATLAASANLLTVSCSA